MTRPAQPLDVWLHEHPVNPVRLGVRPGDTKQVLITGCAESSGALPGEPGRVMHLVGDTSNTPAGPPLARALTCSQGFLLLVERGLAFPRAMYEPVPPHH